LQTLWWTLSHSPNPQRRQGILARTAALRWDLVIEFDANDWSRYLTRRQRADARRDERRRHSLARQLWTDRTGRDRAADYRIPTLR